MDDGIDVPKTEQVEISETTDPKVEHDINVLTALLRLHESLLRSGYNAIKGNSPEELRLHRDRVGKIIIRSDSKHDLQIEILTMPHCREGVTVDDTVRAVVGRADNLEFVGEPEPYPLGLRWSVKISS